MLVRDRMSRHPVTVRPDTSLHDALRIMREEKIRRLPVLDSKDRLVGIVLEKDLLYASPSPATSLSVYELNYLVSKIRVEELMSREVITVCEDCPLEEAARVMVDNHISGLPVMREDALVGMITESDLFKVFLELLGARIVGLRVTIRVPERPGVLARLTQELSSRGGNIIALGTYYVAEPNNRGIVFKVQGVERPVVVDLIDAIEAELIDMREI